MVREAPPEPAPPPKGEASPYPGEKARGARIVLRTPTRQAIFIAGLVGVLLVGLLFVVTA